MRNQEDEILRSIEKLLAQQADAEAPSLDEDKKQQSQNEQDIPVNPEMIEDAEKSGEDVVVRLESIENQMIAIGSTLDDIHEILNRLI
tara:strand:+ start:937 stop:1200 length:264 start_codon:yes stop_codon:yes gene_type:complete